MSTHRRVGPPSKAANPRAKAAKSWENILFGGLSIQTTILRVLSLTPPMTWKNFLKTANLPLKTPNFMAPTHGDLASRELHSHA